MKLAYLHVYARMMHPPKVYKIYESYVNGNTNIKRK